MKMEAGEMKKLLLVLAVLSSSCVYGMTEAEFAELKKKAASGNAEAMCDVGSSYRNGVIVPKNLDLAAEWTQKAASNGSERAMGACYEFGYGVEKDMTEAERWYRKSAERGSQMSQIWIATTLLQRKDFRGAAEQYENFVRRFPESVKVDRARFMTGSCFVKLAENTADKMVRDGYYAKAVQFYEEGYEHARDSKLKSQCGYWAADILERLGMFEEMNLWAARVLPELPVDEWKRRLLGLVRVDQKRQDEGKLPIKIDRTACVSNLLARSAAGDADATRALWWRCKNGYGVEASGLEKLLPSSSLASFCGIKFGGELPKTPILGDKRTKDGMWIVKTVKLQKPFRGMDHATVFASIKTRKICCVQLEWTTEGLGDDAVPEGKSVVEAVLKRFPDAKKIPRDMPDGFMNLHGDEYKVGGGTVSIGWVQSHFMSPPSRLQLTAKNDEFMRLAKEEYEQESGGDGSLVL